MTGLHFSLGRLRGGSPGRDRAEPGVASLGRLRGGSQGTSP